MSQTAPEIAELEDDDGESMLAIAGLPVPPCGTVLMLAPDVSQDSREMLGEILSFWEKMWPEMLERLNARIQKLRIQQKPGRDPFILTAGRSEPDAFMGHESDFLIRLEFDLDPPYPVWDFFVKRSKIVHFQPVL